MADKIDEEAFRDEIAENDDVERELWNEPSKEELAQLVLREPDVYKKGINGGAHLLQLCRKGLGYSFFWRNTNLDNLVSARGVHGQFRWTYCISLLNISCLLNGDCSFNKCLIG